MPTGSAVEDRRSTSAQTADRPARPGDERQWFFDNLDTLRKRYLNKFVAVREGRVVMSDPDHDRLLARLRASKEGRARAKIFLVEPEGTIWAL